MFEWKNKTDDQIAKFVMELFGRAEKRRQVYNDLHDTILKIFRPRLRNMLGQGEKGQQYGARVYDQHPANALSKFVAGLNGYMVSRSIPWHQFLPMDASLMSLDHIKKYCQEATEQALYGAGESNLYSALVPHSLDAHSIGTSVMIPNEDIKKDRVVFDVVHPGDSFLITDRFGDVIGYLRPLEITRLSALEWFGKDSLPTNWFNKDELKDPLSEQEFVYAVLPNNDRDVDSLLPEDREFAVFCVIKGFGRGGKSTKLVLHSGRDIFPICWRSLRESGAEYGTSIAADCLTSALVSNKLDEKGIAAAHQLVEPATIGSKSLRASFMKSGLNPGSRLWTDDISREGIKPVLDRLNWPISDAQMQRIHAQIDDRFFIRFFEMLNTGDIKARTAYEVSQMMAEKATLMSTIVDTFEQESLEPAMEAIIFHEMEMGRMPEVPDELIAAGGKLKIRYLGPLAQLQRTLHQSKGIVDGMAIIAQMAAMEESVAWKFNWLEAAEDAAVAQGWPQKYVRSDEEVAAIKQQVEQDRAMAAQAEIAEKAGKTVESLGKRIEPSSALAQMAGGG